MKFLFDNDFLPFRYASVSAVSKHAGFFCSRLKNELELLLVTLERLACFIIIYLLLFFRSKPAGWKPMNFDRFFMLAIGLGPLVLTILFPLLTGGRIKPTWLASCFSLLAVILFMYLRPIVTKRTIFMQIGAIALVGTILAGEQLYSKSIKAPYFSKKCGYEFFPAETLGKEISARWNKRYATPLKYVIGDRKEGCNLAYSIKGNPAAFYLVYLKICPWIDMDSVMQSGAMIVWEVTERYPHTDKLPKFMNNLGELQKNIIILEPVELERLVSPWARAIMGRPPKTLTVGIAVLPPQSKNK